jgi:hypothetical protein
MCILNWFFRKPQLSRVVRVSVTKSDVLVLRVDSVVSSDQARMLKAYWLTEFPDNKVVILDRNMSLAVVCDAK